MTQFSMLATVKAMKIQEVILKAASNQISWSMAADIIHVSYRTMKRWKARYLLHGYDGIFDRRMKRPSPKRAPLNEVETILKLYRETYRGFNVTHFHEKLTDLHNIKRSYTFVKTLLQTAGEIEKDPPKREHRIKRERKPLIGMMLHLDGSTHEWIPALPGVFLDLLVLLDDATGEIYDMFLVEEENLETCMLILKNCVEKHGIFCSLYSDRAAQFFYTPKAGEKVKEGHSTQINRALGSIGIRMIPAYSPQARGRSERMNQTLQGRLPNEFKLHNIKTADEANRFIRNIFLPAFNKQFATPPQEQGSAFIPLQSHIDLDQIFSIQSERIVRHDNTVQFENLILQIYPSQLRTSFAKCRVMVMRHMDQTLSIAFGPHTLGRYNLCGKPIQINKDAVAA